MILRLEKVSIRYLKVPAIDEVSMEIREGSISALLGANGAGKSTILKAIVGIKEIQSGRIFYLEHILSEMKTEDIVKLGIPLVPEGKKLFPDMTIMENLKMGAYLIKDKGEITRRVEEVFQYFPRLKLLVKQTARSLSGGEAQMLAIGRGMMAKPKLFLLDEPSIGLSPLLVHEVGRIIVNYNKTGVTILLAEQNASLGLKVAQVGFVIQTGKIILRGDTKTLVNNELVRKAYLGGR
jgi:branched-chain amino acid transport system ATP-binding protein